MPLQSSLSWSFISWKETLEVSQNAFTVCTFAQGHLCKAPKPKTGSHCIGVMGSHSFLWVHARQQISFVYVDADVSGFERENWCKICVASVIPAYNIFNGRSGHSPNLANETHNSAQRVKYHIVWQISSSSDDRCFSMYWASGDILLHPCGVTRSWPVSL